MWMKEIRPGVLVGERATPIDSVACYSPRGKGSFPSVTLMTAIPAAVAGVPQPIILTPPGPDGKVDPATLVAARLAGVEQVYKAGGAQAVAAVAYGTATIPRCFKFVGPGNPWVVAAKRLLAGHIDPGLPAGPSETILLADATANPLIAALDMTIESEHGPDSSAFLVTWDAVLARAVRAAIPAYWDQQNDKLAGYSSTVLSGRRGGIVLASSAAEAYAFINDYAPEHCQVLSKSPYEHLAHIRNASEILLGEYAAGSIANYMMGPNCVLPTSSAARTHSPLGVLDFMKTCSVGHMTAGGYAEMAPHTHRFATYEGFDGHANAVSELRSQAMKNA
jgi:histidinol dehydrogenase